MKAYPFLKVLARQLIRRHGAGCADDIRRGLEFAGKVWDFKKHGEKAFVDFCLEQYVPPGARRRQLLERLDEFLQAICGSMAASCKVARAGQDIADRPMLAAEKLFSAYSPDTHTSQDFRRFHIAPLIQLHFGTHLKTPPKSRLEWAARRLGDMGREVIPADLLADFSEQRSQVDRFISSYNLHLDRFDWGDPRIRFPKGTRLVSHWGLRDYMTSLNGQPNALPRQRAILELMRRVVDGEIPAAVLNDPSVEWDIRRGRIKAGGKSRPAEGHGPLRWEKFFRVWRAVLKIDPHTRYGNLIDNKFLQEREIPERTVVEMLTEILASPLAPRVARFVQAQLGRELEPFDVYFRNFLGKSARKRPLRYDIRKRYPDSAALQRAIPGILMRFGWKKPRAQWIGSRIRVDNGRSAGHAWPPHTPEDMQLLRVRIDKGGCDEINFSTFMHELGHCVEGVLSSYELDYRLLWGVPNNSFTEGFAFTFQDRADEILGRGRHPPSPQRTLLNFWEPFEIGGSALTEIRFLHWLYEHKNAGPEAMQRAIRRLGDEVWEEYYARIFGPQSHGLMSVYSHILWGDLYLAEYPLGYILAYQVRKHLENRPLAAEMERLCAQGRIYPEQWMRGAVGQGLSVEPLLNDTEAALKELGF